MKHDLIKREDALKALKLYGYLPLDSLYYTIEHGLPSADRPQGEWVDAEIPLESGDTLPIQVCNLCKTFYPLVYTGGGHRFCPNCGARMLKGVDDGRR